MEPVQLKKTAESDSLFVVSLVSSCQRLSTQRRVLTPELAGTGTTRTRAPRWERAASPGAARVLPRIQETGLKSTCAFLYEKMPITFWEEKSSKESCIGFTQAPTVRILFFFFWEPVGSSITVWKSLQLCHSSFGFTLRGGLEGKTHKWKLLPLKFLWSSS